MDDTFIINARDLYNKLEIKDHFANWIKRKIIKYDLIENVDYIKTIIKVNTFRKNGQIGASNRNEYYITLNNSILIVERDKSSFYNDNVLKWLYSLKQDNTKIIVRNNKRPEIKFLDKLEEALKPFNIKGIRQYCLFKGKYRIDYYIESKNIAIEYDEGQHKNKSNVINDKIRQEEIEKELKCKFIRVSIENSDEYNIGFIIKEIFNLYIKQ